MSAAPKLLPPENFFSLPQEPSGFVYGPFTSLPFGKAIGINILGTKGKACSFNCVYCDLGTTDVRLNKLKDEIAFPSLESLDQALAKTFESFHKHGPGVDSILLSGNGEPTLHPQFPEVMGRLIALRNTWLPGKPITVLTNGANADQRKVYEALNLADHRLVKIDAGNDRLFKLVNSPISRTNLARVLAGVKMMKDVKIQSLFFEGAISNTKSSDIDDWIEVIALIKPKAVHIQGLSRKPSNDKLIACEEDVLYSIAARLERRTQIKATVFP